MGPGDPPAEHRVVLPAPPERALAEVAEAAGEWGASWQPHHDGGRLILPVVQGLRRGVIAGPVECRPTDEGCEITLRIEERDLRINRPALVILSIGAVSGLALALWPWMPVLLQFAPIAFVLAFMAWVLVISRLRMSGATEFLDALADRLAISPD